MTGGRLFQRRLPANGNALLPTVDSRVHCITSCNENKKKEMTAVGIGDELDVIGEIA